MHAHGAELAATLAPELMNLNSQSALIKIVFLTIPQPICAMRWPPG